MTTRRRAHAAAPISRLMGAPLAPFLARQLYDKRGLALVGGHIPAAIIGFLAILTMREDRPRSGIAAVSRSAISRHA